MGLYRDLALDFGTATVRAANKEQGVILQEPNLAAIDRQTGQVLAVGQAAGDTLDRIPSRPMKSGVVADGELAREMLRLFMKKALGKGLWKPRLLLSVPTGISPVEERALLDAALQAGAGKVFLMEAPLAAALGGGLDIQLPEGQMVVNLGAGVTDGAVIAMGRVMETVCIPAAGDRLEEALIQSLRREQGLILSRQTARAIKETMGAEETIPVTGRCLTSGLPRSVDLTAPSIAQAFEPVVEEILSALRDLLERTPPELVRDVTRKGVLLTGGTSRLTGLAQAITQATGIPARIAPDPELAVIQGLAATLPHLNKRKDGPLDLARQK